MFTASVMNETVQVEQIHNDTSNDNDVPGETIDGVHLLGLDIQLNPISMVQLNENCPKNWISEDYGIDIYRQAIAVDLGGPRKEFFALILREIKEKYFSPLREWSPDYTVIGKIFALSFLQNGPLPKLLSVEQLEELFESSTPRPVIQDLRNGLNALGLLQLVKELPSLVHLFTPGSRPFNLKMITTLFKPVFAPEGSNRQIRQLRIYKKFVKYLKEVAAGRRGNLTLRHILMFATSSEEEPILGFTLQPSLNFVQRESFMPTANTCINRLFLTEPEGNRELPSDKLLSNLFDFAFSNTYYGLS
ncbi:unnamed protein product [Mytilus edulis]|uniref:HECT domain-containing protein n=1 Tax=Mytilus edulis TaxID=6550 RepID=A0A8S3SN43_MYTED|nr:unnamed protein product [Mytilus edulis]